jgi:hypothetical protein
MIDQLQEIASYFIEGSPRELNQFGESSYYELKRWWRAAQRWINRLLIAILLWPVAMISCAAWSTWMSQKVVPFLALAPAGFLGYFILKRFNPGVLALLVVPQIRGALGKVLRTLAAVIAGELLLGLYLWLFPISNDRWLLPGLALAVLSFAALRMAQIGAAVRSLLVLVIIGMTVIFVLGGRDKVEEAWRSLETGSAPGTPVIAGYNPDKICESSWTAPVDYRNQSPNYFDVVLTEGCWSGWVYLPRAWRVWYHTPVGDVNGWWVALWYSGQSRAAGPYRISQIGTVSFNNVQSILRLQGHGTVRFYSNQAAETASRHAGSQEAGNLAPLPKEPAIAPVHAGDFRFDVKLCTENGTRIRCYGTVTNTAREPQEFHWRGYESYVLDNLGNQTQLTGQQFKLGDGSGKALLPALPVAFSFVFDAAASADHISIIISLAASRFPMPMEQNIFAALRDIPLVQE